MALLVNHNTTLINISVAGKLEAPLRVQLHGGPDKGTWIIVQGKEAVRLVQNI
jgi:hypothetical protein